MVKTRKNKKSRNYKSINNQTKKMYKILEKCPIPLKSLGDYFSKNKKYAEMTKKQYVKKILSNFAPKNIKPQDDFYTYNNYHWLKTNKVEKSQGYIVQVDDFRLTQDKVYKELDAIILDYVRNNKNRLSKILNNYYKSVTKKNPISYSRKLAKEAEKTIDKFISEKNPWNLLAFINKDHTISYSAPFVWAISPDETDTKHFCSYITPHSFTLLDLEVYFDDGTEVAYKEKYTCQQTGK
jgi:predicted metalloendopeptidase